VVLWAAAVAGGLKQSLGAAVLVLRCGAAHGLSGLGLEGWLWDGGAGSTCTVADTASVC
jgi:hypothetical protein